METGKGGNASNWNSSPTLKILHTTFDTESQSNPSERVDVLGQKTTQGLDKLSNPDEILKSKDSNVAKSGRDTLNIPEWVIDNIHDFKKGKITEFEFIYTTI